MRRSMAQFSLLSLLPFTSAINCPLSGAVFPPPTHLANSSTLASALHNLTSLINDGFSTGNSTHGPVDPSGANAVQTFSLDFDTALFEYYHDGTTLSNVSGVQKVDGDSIFRIGSISKLVSVYMLLIEIGDRYWDTKITNSKCSKVVQDSISTESYSIQMPCCMVMLSDSTRELRGCTIPF
ncbi:hypothetical protein K505DRAFT_65555 [Melanomma pulvis-pyrius CBS 109.77]|uniref:Beta-lactamase-related domain-containing protein n=1 Tax=Melanomma pulvis-pyrius CBS 109.77 TaxID=1314802 RepID=A0A6A6XS41_9PLEO|nr:hypothetical protein K505DRAFT_65555 [Melanomma pulvis-pyrius CBS 109.77]